jgi:hypothetical protein
MKMKLMIRRLVNGNRIETPRQGALTEKIWHVTAHNKSHRIQKSRLALASRARGGNQLFAP